jgi:UDP-GlcNAc:undecaprenyl-phosphate GlcNAc-1-phosphate transferase
MDIGRLVILSLLGTAALAPAMRRVAWRFGAVSRPDGVRRLHDRPTPLWGGVAVCFGFTLAAAFIVLEGTALGLPDRSLTVSLTLSGLLTCLVGMVDDWYPLSAWGKLPGQFVAVLPVLAAGLSVEQISGFGWQLHLGWLGVPCTLGWLLLGINALNLLDGSDGLATTVGLLISLALAVVAGVQGSTEVAILALVLAGALAGFAVYNLPPARIYLGDSGSTLIGLLLASLALEAARTQSGAVNLPALVLLMFVPVLDTGLAIVRRTLKGQAVWSGDRGHLHHQLRDRGFTAWKILLLIGGVCLASGLAAGWALLGGDEGLAVLAMAGIMGFLARRQLLAQQEWTLLRQWFVPSADASPQKPGELLENHGQPLRMLGLAPGGPLNPGGRPLQDELAKQERQVA